MLQALSLHVHKPTVAPSSASKSKVQSCSFQLIVGYKIYLLCPLERHLTRLSNFLCQAGGGAERSILVAVVHAVQQKPS